MEVVVITGGIRLAKLQSNRHHQKTNTQLFTGRMALLLTNHQCQSTEGKSVTFYGFPHSELAWGLPTLSTTNKGSWLPRGKVVMTLVSPLTPVSPQKRKRKKENTVSLIYKQLDRKWCSVFELSWKTSFTYIFMHTQHRFISHHWSELGKTYLQHWVYFTQCLFDIS